MVATKHRKHQFFNNKTIFSQIDLLSFAIWADCPFLCDWIRYKTGNNIDAQETGFIKDVNDQYPNGILVQHGEYQYEAPNGEVVKVKYTADGNWTNYLNKNMPIP